MPEGLEAEIYRRSAERCAGRTIAAVDVDDLQPAADALRAVLPGLTVIGTRRRGKLVVLDTNDVSLGLHFGMTGRLIVDEESAIDRLEYASGRDDPAWNRLVVTFDDGSGMRINDPRRLARFELDPDLDRLGPDFLDTPAAGLTDRLIDVCARRRAALKAVLLDQSVIAGYGNMCVDEILWQCGVAPIVVACELTADRLAAVTAAGEEHLPAMLARGGSHTGTINPDVRAAVPPCPRDGAPMRRDQVGGRTTVWCPTHQVA